MATRELDKKHTAANISTAVREILDEVGAWKPENTYVTENGANVKAAFKDQSWLGCAGHNLNLVLVNGLTRVSDKDDLMSEVTQLIQVCKSVVSHVKKSRIQSKLETSLKQSVSMRWNSILTMLKSIACNTDQLKTLADEFSDRKLQRLLLDVNNQLLTEIISVLQPFDTATRMLSTDHTVSIHLVAATKWQLQKHLQVKVGDSAVTGQLKSQLSSMVDQYFHVKLLHRIAALLDPRLKANTLSVHEKEEAVAAVREMVMSNSQVGDDFEVTEPPAKKTKIDSSQTKQDQVFSDLFNTSNASPVVNEVDAYLNNTESADDILSFWKTKTDVWPKLSQCAKWILAIPATSTSSERSFSVAGRTLDDRRSQLNPDNVDGLLYLHGLSD